MRNCVRCGTHVDEDRALRCPRCRERVDEELNGEVSRPYSYYFKRHLKRMRQDMKVMQKIKEGI